MISNAFTVVAKNPGPLSAQNVVRRELLCLALSQPEKMVMLSITGKGSQGKTDSVCS